MFVDMNFKGDVRLVRPYTVTEKSFFFTPVPKKLMNTTIKNNNKQISGQRYDVFLNYKAELFQYKHFIKRNKNSKQ